MLLAPIEIAEEIRNDIGLPIFHQFHHLIIRLCLPYFNLDAEIPTHAPKDFLNNACMLALHKVCIWRLSRRGKGHDFPLPS